MTKTTTSSSGECAHCGKKIDCGSLFCSRECKENFDRRKQLDVLKCQYKKQKFEEVKKMAWEVILQTVICIDEKKGKYNCSGCEPAWKIAEDFYDYAKQKEEPNSSHSDKSRDLIGSQVRELMRIAETCSAVEDTIHFMYNDYKIIIEKQEEESDDTTSEES